jgi:hypothetical protein
MFIMTLKIKDQSGQIMAILKDQDTSPELTKEEREELAKELEKQSDEENEQETDSEADTFDRN